MRLDLSVSFLMKVRTGERQMSGKSFFRLCEMERENGITQPGTFHQVLAKAGLLKEDSPISLEFPPMAQLEVELWKGRAQRAERENAHLRTQIRKLLEPFEESAIKSNEGQAPDLNNLGPPLSV